MLHTQTLLNQCDSVDEFRAELRKRGIDIREYPEQQMLHLDYNQIEVDKFDPIGRECRGMVMSYTGEIFCKSFNRFFNLGECGVDQFDFENSIAFEKADGSLVRIYYLPATGKWEIATRGTAFAEGPHEWHPSFRKYILSAMGRTEEQFQEDCENNLHDSCTYVFEVVGPENRIVTPYTKNELVYLGEIDMAYEFVELLPSEIMLKLFTEKCGWNVRAIEEYKFNTQEDCLTALGNLTDLKEGYVVFNILTGERVKIKNATYLAAHRLRGNGLTVNAVCELVAMNEQDEYIAVFPDDAVKFEPAIKALAELRVLLVNNYLAATHYMEQFEGQPTAQKEFALYVKTLPLSSVMFTARKKGIDVIQAFDEVEVNKRAEWIKDRMALENLT